MDCFLLKGSAKNRLQKIPYLELQTRCYLV